MESPGLAFAAFSQAASLLPGTSFWAILFFLTLCITELRTFIRVSQGIIFPLQNSMSVFRTRLSVLSGAVDSRPAAAPRPPALGRVSCRPLPRLRPNLPLP